MSYDDGISGFGDMELDCRGYSAMTMEELKDVNVLKLWVFEVPEDCIEDERCKLVEVVRFKDSDSDWVTSVPVDENGRTFTDVADERCFETDKELEDVYVREYGWRIVKLIEIKY